MLDDLSKVFEVLIPRSEAPESVAEVIQTWSDELDPTVEAVGAAVTAMIGSIAERTERVETMAHTTDTVLASTVALDQNVQTVRDMAAGNQLGLKTDDTEAEHQAYVQRLEAEASRLAEARSMSDDQFTIAA